MAEIREPVRAPRQSNIELLRVVAMFIVVMRHACGFTGIEQLYDYSSLSGNMLFFHLFCGWGKTAINAFVVITGYFMCTGRLSPRRFLKLLLEMVFYQLLAFLFLWALGYETLSPKRLFELFGFLFRGINCGFSVSFLWFYLGIPFYNLLVKHLDARGLWSLVAILVAHFTIAPTFFGNNEAFNHTFWYVAIYFIGAGLRLYPPRWVSRQAVCVAALLGGVALNWAWIVGLDWARVRGWVNMNYIDWWSGESSRLGALFIGVMLFVVFRNMKIGYHRWINTAASTTFGILLIHAASPAMHQWLWHDVCDVAGCYALPFWKMVPAFMGYVSAIFVGCGIVDYCRIRFLEKPIFGWLERMGLK